MNATAIIITLIISLTIVAVSNNAKEASNKKWECYKALSEKEKEHE